MEMSKFIKSLFRTTMSRFLTWISHTREYVTDCLKNLALIPGALLVFYILPFLAMLAFLDAFGLKVVEPPNFGDKETRWGAIIATAVISTLLWSGLGFFTTSLLLDLF